MSKTLKWTLIGIGIAVVVVAVVLACVLTIPKKSDTPENEEEKIAQVVQEDVVVDEGTYTAYDDGTATLTDYEVPEGGEVVIPSTVTIDGEEYTITTIAGGTSTSDRMFDDSVTTFTIPSTITTIGAYTLCGDNLTAIYFEGSLDDWLAIDFGSSKQWIGFTSTSSAGIVSSTMHDIYINGNELLTEVIIPEGVETVWGAFCASTITSVVFPSTLKTIGMDTFSRCRNLTSIDLSGTQVTYISGWSFGGCTGIAEIKLPTSSAITYIGVYAFSYTAITEMDLSGTVIESLVSQTFYECNELASVILPETVQSIGESAFRNTAISSITIPSSVISIDMLAFRECGNLTSITIPASVTSIGTNAFYDCTNLAEVTIESSTIYEELTSTSSTAGGRMLSYATTIKVLASIVDECENEYLNNSSNYTRTEGTGDDAGYYIFTKVA